MKYLDLSPEDVTYALNLLKDKKIKIDANPQDILSELASSGFVEYECNKNNARFYFKGIIDNDDDVNFFLEIIDKEEGSRADLIVQDYKEKISEHFN